MKPVGRYTAVLTAIVIGVLLAAGGAAAKPPPKPMLVPPLPSDPSNQPTASFAFTDSQPGVTVRVPARRAALPPLWHESADRRIRASPTAHIPSMSARSTRTVRATTRPLRGRSTFSSPPAPSITRETTESLQRAQSKLQLLRQRGRGDLQVQARLGIVRAVLEPEAVHGSVRWQPHLRGSGSRPGRQPERPDRVHLDDRPSSSAGAVDHRETTESLQREQSKLQLLRQQGRGDLQVQARLGTVRHVLEPEAVHGSARRQPHLRGKGSRPGRQPERRD